MNDACPRYWVTKVNSAVTLKLAGEPKGILWTRIGARCTVPSRLTNTLPYRGITLCIVITQRTVIGTVSGLKTRYADTAVMLNVAHRTHTKALTGHTVTSIPALRFTMVHASFAV